MWCLHGLNDPTMSIFIMIIITRGSAAWLVVAYLYFLRVWWRPMLVSFVYHDRSTDYWLPKCIILPANLIVRLLTAVDRTRDYLAGRFAWWWLPGIIYYLALFMPRYPINGFEHYVLFFTWWLGRYYISYWRPRGDINYAACVPAYYAGILCYLHYLLWAFGVAYPWLWHHRRGIFIILPHDLCYLHRCTTDY